MIYNINEKRFSDDLLFKYAHKLIKVTKNEFQFFKLWKLKCLADNFYQLERLEEFITFDKENSDEFLQFIDNIN